MKGVNNIYIFSKKLLVDFPNFLIENYDMENYMILDIETTGLSSKYTEVILVGIIYYKDNNWVLTQLFCDHRNEEKELLNQLKNYIHQDHLLITYNGHAFDIPYLNQRFKHHGINYHLPLERNFDLYRVIRTSKKALNLDNYKLKTIETYLGIERSDQISGKESVELYVRYEQKSSESLRHIILLHNSDDIEYMIPTLKILNDIPHDIIEKYYPFVANDTFTGKLVNTSYHIEADYIEAIFKTTLSSTLVDYSNQYTFVWQENTLTIKLPIFHLGDRIFIDIDELDFIDSMFNDISYDEQIHYELLNKKNNIQLLIEIINNYMSNHSSVN